MQNIRNKNIPMIYLISSVRATYLYGNTNRIIKIIDMMKAIATHMGTMDKSVLVEGERARTRYHNKESRRS